MEILRSVSYTLLSLLLLSFVSDVLSINGTLLSCLENQFPDHTNLSQILYFPNTTAYTTLRQSSIRNLRFLHSPYSKPLLIIAPRHESHIQASIFCCKKQGVHLRIRSGGHDYEGLSYLSHDPFVILDLFHFRSVRVDVGDSTAWVDAGATLGELYHAIATSSRIHGFPAGHCHTVAAGGHFSGGGVGNLVRKYGLSADNILDAIMVDSHGRVLNRKSMGEGMFWAIIGGGGGSFGVIVSWKIKLVNVSPIVTVFNIEKRLEEDAIKLVHKWQYIADKLPDDISLTVHLEPSDQKPAKRVQAIFKAFYLGGVVDLLHLMGEWLPELGVKPENCVEMSWVKSCIYYAGFPVGSSQDVLLSRELSQIFKNSIKGRYDFVQHPIPEEGLMKLWKMVQEEVSGTVTFDPMGGKMNEIEESEIPFPHRKGNLYNLQYVAVWHDEKDADKCLDWIKRIYDEMGMYVSKNPRGAYINVRDLDLGQNEEGRASFSAAKIWGLKYFKGNFRKLAIVKGMVDEDNFFRNEQSIPPLIPGELGVIIM